MIHIFVEETKRFTFIRGATLSQNVVRIFRSQLRPEHWVACGCIVAAHSALGVKHENFFLSAKPLNSRRQMSYKLSGGESGLTLAVIWLAKVLGGFGKLYELNWSVKKVGEIGVCVNQLRITWVWWNKCWPECNFNSSVDNFNFNFKFILKAVNWIRSYLMDVLNFTLKTREKRLFKRCFENILKTIDKMYNLIIYNAISTKTYNYIQLM